MDTLNLFPSMICSMGCEHCWEDDKTKEQSMDDSLLERLLSEARDTNLKILTLSWGELTDPKYKWELFNLLKKLSIWKEMAIILETNSWWAKNERSTNEQLDIFEESFISYLLLSMDSFHQRFIDVENIARVISSLKDRIININWINVRTFKSTIYSDRDLILKLSELIWEEIWSTSIHYIPHPKLLSSNLHITGADNDQWNNRILNWYKKQMAIFHTYAFYVINDSFAFSGFWSNQFLDITKVFDDIKRLEYLISADYLLWESTPPWMLNTLLDSNWIHIQQQFWMLKWRAEDKFEKSEQVGSWQDGKKSSEPALITNPAIIPDWSILPNCNWDSINNPDKHRIWFYPEMNLRDIQELMKNQNEMNSVRNIGFIEVYKILWKIVWGMLTQKF